MDTLVRQGKVRYIGCSNFSAWHLMKALWASDSLGLVPFISHQIYYSLIGRDAEYELVPAGIDQGVGTLVWSPLAGGLLSGKYRRDREWPADARHSGDWHEPPVSNWEFVYDVVDVRLRRRRGPSSNTCSGGARLPAVETQRQFGHCRSAEARTARG